MANWVTYQEYELYVDEVLSTAVRTLLTDSYIPEAQELIEENVGFGFAEAAFTDEDFTFDIDTAGSQLFFKTWAWAVESVTQNSVVISSDNYVLLGEGPYYGVKLLGSGGDFWGNFGDDPENSIVVSAKWAFSETAPVLIKKAIYTYIQDSLKNRKGTAIDVQTNIIRSIMNLFPSFMPFARD